MQSSTTQWCGGDDIKMAISTDGEKLFLEEMYTERKSNKSDTVQQEKPQLDISKKSLQNSINVWNALEEAVEFPTLEIFKTALGKALGNLI